ncbi:MAG TPA: BglG family transcription antiterminator [Bacillales bacterium]|nr:BglG family transcription antiterminator [Bacillales bacterium]
MTLDQRSVFILRRLLHSNDYVFVHDLESELRISRRTIYYDLHKINDWLAAHQLEPVQRSYSKGFYLSAETKKKAAFYMGRLRPRDYFLSKKERLAYVMLYLLLGTGRVRLQELEGLVNVSRVTVFKDLRTVKDRLRQAELALTYHRGNGYVVEGDESEIRRLLARDLLSLMGGSAASWHPSDDHRFLNSPAAERLRFTKPRLTAYETCITLAEQSLHIEWSDEMISHFHVYFYIIAERVKAGRHVEIDSNEQSALVLTREYSVARDIAERLGKIESVVLDEHETCYLTKLLLGSKRNTMDGFVSQNEDMEALRTGLREMIERFQQQACVSFEDPHKLEALMFQHLMPAYYRMKYGVYVDNPLTEQIKTRYAEVYALTRMVVDSLENFVGREINDGEIAYLAMYFGGWMRRRVYKRDRRKKAVVVCGSGAGTSALLRIQLEQFLPSVRIIGTRSLREEIENESDVDFYFSTVPMPSETKPVILVNPVLTDAEQQQIANRVLALTGDQQESVRHKVNAVMDIVSKYADIRDEEPLQRELHQLFQSDNRTEKETRKPMLNELLTEETIRVQAEAGDWQEAIKIAAEPLLQSGSIEENYVEAMINNVKELGPYIVIVPQIAIPHARPEQGVNRLGMSLLTLKEPVPFSAEAKHAVRLMIVLAAIDSETHLKALSQLTGLLADEEIVTNILESDSAQAVSRLISGYLSNQTVEEGKR